MIFRSKAVSRVAIAILILLAVLNGNSLAGDSLTVVISGNYRGRVLGCGCDAVNSGGLPRTATAVKEKLNGTTRLPVAFDAGRFLDLDPDKGKVASRCTLLGMAKLGLVSAGVTPRDMFYGVPFLRQTAQSAKITLLSANMTDSSGNLLFERWMTVKSKTDNGTELVIAVTSLAGYQEGERFTNAISAWRVTPTPDVMANLKATRPKADITLLLTDMGERDLREYFEADDLFDIIASSSRQLHTPAPFVMGKAVVASPSLDGRNLEGFRIGIENSGNGSVAKRSVWFTHILAGRVDEDQDMLNYINNCQMGQ